MAVNSDGGPEMVLRRLQAYIADNEKTIKLSVSRTIANRMAYALNEIGTQYYSSFEPYQYRRQGTFRQVMGNPIKHADSELASVTLAPENFARVYGQIVRERFVKNRRAGYYDTTFELQRTVKQITTPTAFNYMWSTGERYPNPAWHSAEKNFRVNLNVDGVKMHGKPDRAMTMFVNGVKRGEDETVNQTSNDVIARYMAKFFEG